jgi:hypothetical protein
MRKIHVGTPYGGTQIIEVNEDGGGVLKIRHHKMTDPTVTLKWVEKPFSSIDGGLRDCVVLADGTHQMSGHTPDVTTGTLYLR